MSATNDARLQVIPLARATADDSLDPEAVDALVSGMDEDLALVAAARRLTPVVRVELLHALRRGRRARRDDTADRAGGAEWTDRL